MCPAAQKTRSTRSPDSDSDDASGNAEWAGLVGGPQAAASGGKPAVVAGLGGIRGRRQADSNTEG